MRYKRIDYEMQEDPDVQWEIDKHGPTGSG